MTVESLLERYGIRVERYPWQGEHRQHAPPVDSESPAGCAGIRWPDTIVAEEDAADHYVLHEGVHLIMAPTLKFHLREEEPEEEGLLQLERALARYLSPMSRRGVIDWMSITMVAIEPSPSKRVPSEVGAWKHPLRTSWWRDGKARAVQLGVLTPEGRPTWRRRPLETIPMEARS